MKNRINIVISNWPLTAGASVARVSPMGRDYSFFPGVSRISKHQTANNPGGTR